MLTFIFSLFLLIIKLNLAVILGVIYFLNSKKYLSDSIFNKYSLIIIKFLGPAFIKFIQLYISERNLCEQNVFFSNLEFTEKLQEMLDQTYYTQNLETIEIDGCEYEVINKSSYASGSMAYIYKINYQNYLSILKVSHSYLKSDIYSGVYLLKIIKNFMILFRIKGVHSVSLDNNFTDYLLIQSDMENEVNNMNNIRNIFIDFPTVHVPDVYYNNKSNIVMSFENGVKYNDFIENNTQEDKNRGLFLLVGSVYHMARNGYFHGDLHLGNFLFYKKNNNIHITLLDFGIVQQLSDLQIELILKFIDNFSSGKNRDIKVLVSILEFVWNVIHKKNEDKQRFLDTFVNNNYIEYFSTDSNNNIIIDYDYTNRKHINHHYLRNKLLLELQNNGEYKLELQYVNMFSSLFILEEKIETEKELSEKFYKQMSIFLIDNDFIE
jgi:predicted unusual protein kinase regulating ubiquinone biosynthesis (AarF/ABC1/UbiB family)